MGDDSKSGADDADVQKLASDYVDLWEQQIKALAKDETLAAQMVQTLQLMNAGAANVAAMMQGMGGGAGAAKGSDDDDDTGGRSADGDGTDAGRGGGAAPAAAASGDPEPDLRDVVGRLAELEKRLDRLESLIEPEGKRPLRRS